MSIDTRDDTPYRLLLEHRENINLVIDVLIPAGVIESTRSSWSLTSKKKDDCKRLCVDFRALNKIIWNNSHPPNNDWRYVTVPRLTNFFFIFLFSKLDLKSDNWQVEIHEDDKEKSTFTCQRGLFYFSFMPFRLANGSGMYQELVLIIWQNQKTVLSYLDDI